MNTQQEHKNIPGYDYGTDRVAKSPITLDEWETLKKSALFSEEDAVYLRLSYDVLADQVDDLLDTWRGIIFDHPHLRAYDEDPEDRQGRHRLCWSRAETFRPVGTRHRERRVRSDVARLSVRDRPAPSSHAKKIRLITGIPSGTFAPATCSLSAPRSWFR